MIGLRVSIIVPVRNAEHEVLEQLDALSQQSILAECEVIVVDDASTDATAAQVRAWIAGRSDHAFRLLSRPSRGGPNASRNDGIRHTSAPILLFCDGDDRVAPGWANALVSVVSDGVIAGGNLLRYEGNPVHDRDWVVTGLFSYDGWQFAPGGNMGMPRDLAIAIGGFDENILAGGTETDFAIRAQQAGAKLVSVPGAVVEYRLPATSRTKFVRLFQRERGRAYMARKLDVGERSPFEIAKLWTVLFGDVWSVLRRRPHARGELVKSGAAALGGTLWWLRFRLRLPRPLGLPAQ